jgi:phytoene synthase
MHDVAHSYAYAARITRAAARNFYYSFRFLTPERRRSIFAVYAYSRRLDDAVDGVEERGTDPDEARALLDHLRSFLSGEPPSDPLVPALRDTIAKYSIPVVHFEELIDGMRMDLSKRRYRTFEDLYRYCYRAASAVGLICIEIFGYDDREARLPAEHLGIAMQLTNILRDVAEDLRRGRIYLPLADLERFGYSERELEARVVDDRFRALMEFEVGRARHFFSLADALFPHIRPESRYCPILLKRFYSAILARIERQAYDIFSKRPRLPLYRKLQLAAATWLEARRGRR